MAKPTLLLYPGAGTGCDHPSLLVTERRLSPKALVERRDFPYRRHGLTAPDRAPKLMAAIRDDLAGFSRRRGPIVMGGRSMGGRITTMVAADVDKMGAVGRLAGLVLVCYPLHPPGKPATLRVEHLPQISVPCLFISGTRDPFGTPDELEQWTASIPAPVEHHWIEGGRHDLRGADNEIAERVATFLGSVTR